MRSRSKWSFSLDCNKIMFITTVGLCPGTIFHCIALLLVRAGPIQQWTYILYSRGRCRYDKTLTSLPGTSSRGECCCWAASCLAHYQSPDRWPDPPEEPSCPWALGSGCSAVCSCLCSRSWWRLHGADDSASGSGRAAEGASAAESGSERLPLGEQEGKKTITRHIRDNLRISAKMLKFCSEALLKS